MKAVTNIMLSGAAIAALVSAAPAAAQYYPGQGYNQGYNNNNNVVSNILNSILGGQNYQQNDRYAIDMCVRATEARLNGYRGSYNYNNYGNYGGYGNQGYYQGYNGSRVTRITNVQRRNSGLKIFGLATAGYNNRYGGYNQGYGNQGYGNQGYGAQLRFNCKTNSRGQVTDVDIDRRRY